MQRIKRMIGSKEFSFYLFIISAFLFSAPFFVLEDIMSAQKQLYIYLFLVWGLLVLIMFFMSRSCED